jgi:uroporphyrinogen decarboxylase
MNSYEIMLRTLEFSGPERVAHSFEPSDIVMASPCVPNPEGGWRRVEEQVWERTDEWGNLWRRLDATSKGEVAVGAVPDLAQAASCPLPDFSNPDYYEIARQAFTAAPDRWKVGGIQGLTFSIARKQRRMEQYLMDLLLDRERLRVLHDRVDQQIRAQIEQLAAAGADSIMFWEDWGTQNQMLISPRLWRDEFKPRFRELCACAHERKLKVFMHSCGKMTAIIPDLIEVGIDLLQFDQPQVHGTRVLARFQEDAHITFWCGVDIQTTLQTRNEPLIRREAADMIASLWRGRGGFVAGYYSDEASINLEPCWQQMAIEEFLRRGVRTST